MQEKTTNTHIHPPKKMCVATGNGEVEEAIKRLTLLSSSFPPFFLPSFLPSLHLFYPLILPLRLSFALEERIAIRPGKGLLNVWQIDGEPY